MFWNWTDSGRSYWSTERRRWSKPGAGGVNRWGSIWRNTTKCARIHSKFKHLTQMFDISWNSSVHLCNSYVKPEERMRSDPWNILKVSQYECVVTSRQNFSLCTALSRQFQVDGRCSVLTAAVRFSFNKRRKLWIYMIKVKCRQRNIKPVWVVNKPSGRGSATRRTNCCFSVSLQRGFRWDRYWGQRRQSAACSGFLPQKHDRCNMISWLTAN